MKKLVTLVLALCLVVCAGNANVLAAEETPISIAEDNLNRGSAMVGYGVSANADGSLTSQSSNISFYLPEAVAANEKVTIHVTGSSDGDFRMWLIDINENTNSEIFQMSVDGFTSGAFDKTFVLTATAESTELFFKAPTWDGKINNLTITSLTITKGDTTAAGVDDSPKTGDNSNALYVVTVLAVAMVGFVVITKKKAINEQ